MKFLEAVLTLSGMIIGVGMFGIPFSFVRAGFWVGTAELVLLSGLVLIFHFIYGEIVLSTRESHRIPGYINMYLGGRFLPFAYFSAFFGVAGTLLAYMLIGASFFETIAAPFIGPHSFVFWAALIVGAVAGITFFPLRREAVMNGILTVCLIGFLVYLIGLLLPDVSFSKLAGADFSSFFLPYGVLLFALSGSAAIPDIAALLGRKRALTRRAIFVGTVIPSVLYFLFALAVVGTTGDATTPDAVHGLGEKLGPGVIYLVSLIGFFAVLTSFIVVSSNFQALLVLDAGFSSRIAWAIASVTPFILYGAGVSNFIQIMGVVGAVAVGIEFILILAAYHELRKTEGVAPSVASFAWKATVCLLIIVGIFYSFFDFFL